MTENTWTSAPAGVLGQGITDVRPYPGVVVCPTPGAVHGTGLPAGGFAAEVRGTAGDEPARLRPLTVARTRQAIAQSSIAQQSTENDVTTLGIRYPGRPQS